MMPSFLIPVRRLRSLPGSFTWPRRVGMVSARDADAVALEGLKGYLKRYLGRGAVTTWRAGGTGDVCIIRDAAVKGEEAYRLTVTPAGIEVAARTDAGAFYGVQTLQELIVMHGQSDRALDVRRFRRPGAGRNGKRA